MALIKKALLMAAALNHQAVENAEQVARVSTELVQMELDRHLC